MKSVLLSASLLIFFSFTIKAQWVTNGTLMSTNTPADNNYSPEITVNSANSFWITWRAEDTTVAANGNIYLTGYDKMGFPLSGFNSGPIDIGDGGNYYMPQITMSKDTDLIVAWYGYADTSSSLSEIYIQKYNASGNPLWNGGVPIQVSAKDAHHNKYPHLASDLHGGAYVSWTQYDLNLDFSSLDILLQRVDSSGHVASGWPAMAAAVADSANEPEMDERIAVTPAGDAVYVQYYEGYLDSISLKLKKVNASNGSIAAGFTNPSSGLVISEGPYLNPNMLVDGFVFCDSAGDALSVWSESRTSGNGEIYYQKTSAAGVRTFPLAGKGIAGNSNEGYSYLYASLDDDGAILATWNDYVVNYDVGGAKFKADGTAIWTHSTPITTNNNSAYPKVIPDHLGGSYIFYVDVTNNPRRLNCLRLNASGNLVWNLPGLFIGYNYNQDGFDPQFDFQAANVNSQQSYTTWEYSVTNLFNVYACDALPSEQSCVYVVTGLQEANAPQEISVYPNPAAHQLTINNSQFATKGVYIYNLLGEMSLQSEIIPIKSGLNSEIEINVSFLSPGIYFVEVIGENQKWVGKFVKE